jgi:hypothetical protein
MRILPPSLVDAMTWEFGVLLAGLLHNQNELSISSFSLCSGSRSHQSKTKVSAIIFAQSFTSTTMTSLPKTRVYSMAMDSQAHNRFLQQDDSYPKTRTRIYYPPSNHVAYVIWRWVLWFYISFPFSMMEPWETVLVCKSQPETSICVALRSS